MDDLDDGSLALRIDVRRGLVEHVRRRISEQGASQRESLPLTTRKVSAFLRYRCIEPARLLHEPLCASHSSSSLAWGSASSRFERTLPLNR